jgi:hypothetical protein
LGDKVRDRRAIGRLPVPADCFGGGLSRSSAAQRTLQLAPDGQVGDGHGVADQEGAQRQEVVDAGAHGLQAQAGHDRRREVQPGVDLSDGQEVRDIGLELVPSGRVEPW